MIPMFVSSDKSNELRLARLLCVVKTAFDGLREFYADWNPSQHCDRAVFAFPPTVSEHAVEGVPRRLTCVKQLFADKLVFECLSCSGGDGGDGVDDGATDAKEDDEEIATKSETIVVVVKFARRYSRDAHDWTAQQGLAPRLLSCSPVWQNSTWQMVVMEKLADDYQELQSSARQLLDQAKGIVYNQLKEWLTAFHDGGFVFGDLRPPNVMVSAKAIAAGHKGVRLVDFDWAGKQGDCKYPPFLNREDICWHPDVRVNALVMSNHDEFMLNGIRRILGC